MRSDPTEVRSESSQTDCSLPSRVDVPTCSVHCNQPPSPIYFFVFAQFSLASAMSEESPRDGSTPSLLRMHYAAKPQRVLACILCQQRKVKCDRKFPCAVCTKAGVQCISAAIAPRQRRRRFPERELLDRLRDYGTCQEP
ncbi:hypothetical protein FB567DRAFT_532512 [Paraphoma chrysanthemicola]|uniref:Zn(2)-C6 fungal-type domain-containing protein n=1 Tax=Paraphoma chrysanthemicola TaxID=798071 RepID=A0A8K0QRQ3_9PLEO|nr:hypothetical protein FB567DRAFT_542706 [Paraphoma chrysanthemicola]KAH7066439.1 hypothetical protein FB567DRAFT_542678 [Paraphoma chrysanthemicola]KAH7067959.1 hypothetical protein FB567DRAFT_541537 [Paraphoma chrysanthemicola]KAH7079410.1 hypothetical protein FB567DRAFT_532512 [Paraphoma chrysanthemicola]